MGSMGHTRYKEGTFIAMFVIGLVLALVAGVFIPKEGMVGLICNLVKYIAVLAAIIGIIMAIAHNLSVKNPVTVNAYLKSGYVLSGIVALIGIFCIYNFICDITGESVSKTVPMGRYEVEAKTIRGIGGFYYIKFDTDDGIVKFPISAGTYKNIGNSIALNIDYYPHSQVIKKIESSSGSSLVDDIIEEYSEGGLSGVLSSIFGTDKKDSNNSAQSDDTRDNSSKKDSSKDSEENNNNVDKNDRNNDTSDSQNDNSNKQFPFFFNFQ